MAQLQGTLSFHAQQIEADLMNLFGLTEASFEFLDEEQQDIHLENIIKEKFRLLIEKTEQVLANFSQQKQIRDGIRIAIVGQVNVGKSTLFNTLVNQERAIVTKTPGTTRDAIETTLYQNGTFWLLIDTAGLRKTKSIIEQKGIDRSWQEAAQSDIILLVFDSTKKSTPEEVKLYQKIHTKYKNKVIMIANKIDQLTTQKDLITPLQSLDSIQVSAKDKTGIDKLKATIEEKVKKLFEQGNGENAVVFHADFLNYMISTFQYKNCEIPSRACVH